LRDKKNDSLSAVGFLGGVTLGTRGGVPPQMKFEFQATGVAHVLSVSGLHAGFIAALFFMLCQLLKIPPKPRWFVVSVGLLIFTLITGARPATMRSAIMYSMLLFFNTFGLGLKASTALTIPVSGCLILLFNPLLLPSASFVLSYAAVWSLCYLTGPVQAFFEKYIHSSFFLIFFLWIFLLTAITIVDPALFKNPNFIPFCFLLFVLSVFLGVQLEKLKHFEGLAINRMPPLVHGLVLFFYAQFAIQIGMMFPLSAVYFHRLPIAGVYANFIAIPLIGLIVMIGFLAGLIGAFFSAIGLAPVGTFIALCLNAGNYWLTKAFTGTAHFFFRAFPYPFMPTFHLKWLLIYYFSVFLIILYKPILDFVFAFKEKLKYLSKEEIYLRGSLLVAAILLFVFFYNVKLKKEKTGKLSVVAMALGFGNCDLIKTPLGRSILIDSTLAGKGNFNFQNLAAALSYYHVGRLERMVLTNIKPENSGNCAEVLSYFSPRLFAIPYDVKGFLAAKPYQDFLDFLGDENIKEKWDSAYVRELYRNYEKLMTVNLVAARDFARQQGIKSVFSGNNAVPVKTVSKGDILYFEKVGKEELVIKVLWPPKKFLAGTDDDLANNSVVLKLTYGKFSMLFPSDIKKDAQYEMLKDASDLKSTVLVAAYHGHLDAAYGKWIDAVSPSIVLVPYVYTKGYSFYESDISPVYEHLEKKGVKVYRFDRTGAVEITTSGRKVLIKTTKKAGKVSSGESSFEDSLDVF